jgi:protein-disulfide isomerase
MQRARPYLFASILAWFLAVWLGCSPRTSPVASPTGPAPAQPAAPTDVGAVALAEPAGDPGPIPVSSADPTLGRADALVTMVWFGDFQCPFTSRVTPTLDQLRARYRPDQLRIVWKNLPLPFHAEALPAADAAMAVYAAGGNQAFWKFASTLLVHQSSMGGASYEAWAREAGVFVDALHARLTDGGASAKVDEDVKLARDIGADGTPQFYVNGVAIGGAQPVDKFIEVVDAELARAEQGLAAGVPRAGLYGRLTAEAWKRDEPERRKLAVAEAEKEDDKATFRVPVGSSPVRGKATAPVTIVEFVDFQCPFCKRVKSTLDEVRKRYGDDVRLVVKHNPLPFHARAEPAAEVALEARAEKGDDGFFHVHDALFDSEKLEDADLESIARQNHLDLAKVKKAVMTKKYADVLAEDADLAEDVKVFGTPQFFINGRRLVGAQPIEKFASLIDEELARAKALVAKGITPTGVYEELQKSAQAPDPPEMKTLPAPTSDQPVLGARNAKVVIVEFSDFQCPFCNRVEPTLEELMKLYPGQLKIVWRHRPLGMHPDAHLAAEAAVEVFRQKGNDAFWAYRKLLFARQSAVGGLKKSGLQASAKQLGLDENRFAAALDDHRNAALVDTDVAVADAAGISGTPSFVINGVFLSGAQPIHKFRRIIDEALHVRH